LSKTRKHAITGEGSVDCDMMIVGQAPGREEDKEGRMFVGPSGEVLDNLLKDTGFSRRDFYMTNLLKCMLPKSRKPRQDEIDTCTELYLMKEISIVNPKIIIPLGYHSTKTLLKTYNLVVPNRHHFPELFGSLLIAGNRRVLPLRHPAAVVHSNDRYPILESNYKKIKVISKTCKWFHVCPIKTFYDKGKLPKYWIDKYCQGDWTSCIRYKLEEKYMHHPDNMLPDGTIDHNL
jgi:DNA polymerase